MQKKGRGGIDLDYFPKDVLTFMICNVYKANVGIWQ